MVLPNCDDERWCVERIRKTKICTTHNYKGEKIEHFPYNVEAENVNSDAHEIDGWKI
jgi:adenylosuccinate synthase